jgi:hypothetical protein
LSSGLSDAREVSQMISVQDVHLLGHAVTTVAWNDSGLMYPYRHVNTILVSYTYSTLLKLVTTGFHFVCCKQQDGRAAMKVASFKFVTYRATIG